MPIRIVLDPPHRLVFRAPRETARALVGGLLLLIGILASIPAVPLTFAVMAIAAQSFSSSEQAGSSLSGVPVGEIVRVWVAATIVAVIGCSVGLKLLRGKRQLVLFLRRFGFDEAREVVTFAVASSIGRAWRLVTLDDHEVAALGVPTSTRRLFQFAGLGSRTIGALSRLMAALPSLAGAAWAAMLGIIAIDALGKRDWVAALPESAFKYFKPIIAAVQSGRIDYDLGANLESVFVVLAGIIVVLLLIALISIAFYFLAIPLIVPIGLFTSSIEAVAKAEQTKRRSIDNPLQVDALAIAIAQESRGVFSPRLVVLTVSAAAWRHTVSRLAMVSSAILIDISEPTENLVWEVRELRERFGSRFLLVGDHRRLQAINEVETPASNPHAAQLLDLLDGQEVLAYDADGRGMRRFGRALRDKLETLPARS